MKKMTLVVAAVAALGLTACDDHSSPQGIVGTAYKTLKKNDTKKFTKTLTGHALTRFGTLEGMITLQKEIAGLDVTTGDVLLEDSQRDYRGWDKSRVYNVTVLGKESIDRNGIATPIFNVDVTCSVTYTYNGRGPWEGSGHGPGFPYSDAFALERSYYGKTPPPWYNESSWCLISEIRL